MNLEDLDTPVLLVDRPAFERNLRRMSALAAESGLACRPHAKAHKSPEIARRQIDAGAVGICCAKLGEAEVMAAAGIPDILITTGVIGRSKAMRLASAAEGARIAVVVDDAENVDILAAAAQTAGRRLDVLVEIDVGQGRCGVPPGPRAAELAARIADHRWLAFRGLQGYQGSAQMRARLRDRRQAVRTALDLLLESAELVRRAGLEVAVLTGGGTGTSALDAALGGLTELQPGSYVFMDSNYQAIEWTDAPAPPFECALFVYAGAISRPAPHRVILDAGWKTISGDGGLPSAVDHPGATFRFAGDEHCELTFQGTAPLAVGDKAMLMPSHCDTTVNLHDRFIVIAHGAVEDVWEIAARGRSQ